MQPLSNRRHEVVALLTAAGFDRVEACQRAGMSIDPSNMSKLFRRHDLNARIAHLKGESDGTDTADMNSLSGIRAAMSAMAANPGTSDAARARLLEFLASAKVQEDYVPEPGKPFEVDRLSAAQRNLCEAYMKHMTTVIESPGAEIARRLALLAERQAKAA